MKKFNIAVVGATGLVGSKMLKVLNEKQIPINNLYLFASKKSEGKTIMFKGKKYRVIALNEANVKNKKIDFALFSAGGAVSLKFAPIFAKLGAVVIDNSSAFRMHNDVPLVVPQVNMNESYKNKGIIANPNCSTIQCMAPLKAFDKEYGLKQVNYTTFQATSGSGIKGLKDLKDTTKGKSPKFYPYSIYNNCLPHIGNFLDNGYTEEELKMINETKKILNLPKLKVSATCVRVPITNSHSVQIEASFKKPLDLSKVFDLLKNFEGIILLDDIKNNKYPLATIATSKDEVFVGRVRLDLFDNKKLHMFTVADNIRKGAATNAVEILEQLIKTKE